MGGIKSSEKPKFGGRPPGKIDASLNEKLKNVEWGEYKIGDLFESSNGNFDIQKNHINGKGEYVITSGLTDNGILGKSDVIAKIFNNQTITVDMFGNAFYRQFKYKMVTHARVFSLKPKFKVTDNQGLYISNSFQFLKYKFGYENMCSWEKIKNEKIQLPTKNGEIDFEFMESFIAELEAERIAELSAYLSVSGLDNYELSSEEEKALKNLNHIEWGEYKIGDLFEINPTKYYRLSNDDIISHNGTTPLVSNASVNNGVMGFSNLKALNPGNTISCSDTTLGAETMYYQKNEYIGYQHIQSFIPKFKPFNYSIATFIISSARNATSNGQYDSGHKFNRESMRKTRIFLPTKNGEPDFATMETLISAVQKLVIKDVVLYADRKIEATKEVITK